MAGGALGAVTACDYTELDVIVPLPTEVGVVVPIVSETPEPSEPTDPDPGQTSVDQTPAPDASAGIDWDEWGNDGADGGTSAEAGSDACRGALSLDEESYRIKARGSGCLTNGDLQSLPSPAGPRVTSTELVVGLGCTNDPSVNFKLVPSLGGWFELNHEATELNVDVLFAEYEVGNLIVLYEAHGRSVQWFRFSPARDDFVSISPERDSDLCLTRSGNDVQLQLCTPGDAAQEWQLLGRDCDETQL